MNRDDLEKLAASLEKRLTEIDKELSAIASENPLVRGAFNVKVEDLGESQEDAAQEAGELDRQQALVTTIEKERKEIINTLEKIKSGDYGKCEKCLAEINPARLKAMPIAALCINCAQKIIL